MAKAKKSVGASESDLKLAAEIAVLKRAIAQREDAMEDSAVKLPPGTYDASLTVRISGEITVNNPPPPGDPVSDYTHGELATALVMNLPVKNRDSAVAKAIRSIKGIRGDKASAKSFKAVRESIDDQCESVCKEIRLRKPATAKQGATIGTPSVEITGEVKPRGGCGEMSQAA